MINANLKRPIVQPDSSEAGVSPAPTPVPGKIAGKVKSAMQSMARRPRTMIAFGAAGISVAASAAIVHSYRLQAVLPPPKFVVTQTVAVPVAAPPVKHKSLVNPLRGIASWYGNVLHGHKTASGEVFDETKMTACHNSLPFGTHVLVTDIRSKKSVVVRINDRGELSQGRVIDLSSAAADRLGILRAGIAQVTVKVLPASTAFSEELPSLKL